MPVRFREVVRAGSGAEAEAHVEVARGARE
jgi:hypothetical protein